MNKGPYWGPTPAKVQERCKRMIEEHGARKAAAMVGLHASQVHRYSKGEGFPAIRTLQTLANYFGESFIIEIHPEVKG